MVVYDWGLDGFGRDFNSRWHARSPPDAGALLGCEADGIDYPDSGRGITWRLYCLDSQSDQKTLMIRKPELASPCLDVGCVRNVSGSRECVANHFHEERGMGEWM